jgi:ATP-dependent Clp protease ATP-binding subunit ClpB
VAPAERIAYLRDLEPHLRAQIRGQDHAVGPIAAAFCRAALQLPAANRPRASLLLVGPTGTGKSETFLRAAEYVYGREQVAVFDMSEYQDDSALRKLLGADRHDHGLLGRALAALSGGALLFDEVEKAHPPVIDVFLQVLWRGCVTAATGQTFSTCDYVVGFSSNIGAAEAMRMAHSRFASIEQATLRRVDQTLRPEFVGRLDERLVFARLTPGVQREICELEVRRETARLRGVGYDLAVSPAALEFLIREGFHPHLGARPLKKAVERHLQDAVMRDLFGTGVGSGRIEVDPPGRQLVVRH